MSFDFSTLITDRTDADVSRVQEIAAKIRAGTASESELAEFNSCAMKGAYNYTDLNRVTAAMDALKAKLEGYGYAVPGYQRIKIDHVVPGASRLPEGYIELAYIQSSGTQYFDTGFKHNQNTRVVMDVQMTTVPSGNNVWLFDGRNGTGANVASKSVFFYATSTSLWTTDYDGSSSRKNFSGIAATGRLNIDYNKNVCTINGQTVTHTAGSFQSNYNLFLLADNRAGTAMYPASAMLFSCQIYDNGTLIRDYVPCIDPSGEVGLYDLVTATFFGNSGTGVFIAGTPVVTLPDGYTQVEHLESTGTQYVVTDFIPNQDTKLVIVAMPSTIDNAASSNGFVPYGAGNSSTDGAFECYTWNSNHEANYDGQRGTLGTATASVLVAISHNKNNFVLTDGTGTVLAKEFTYNEFTSPRALTLFAANRASPLKGKQKIYLCLLYDNGTLVRFYIPCVNASGEAGLYDLVGAKFYGNAGSGAFAAGDTVEVAAAVSVVEDADLDPYLWYEFDWPTESTMALYLGNVAAIRSVLELLNTTPQVPGDVADLTVQEANDIEQILFDVEKVIYQVVNGFSRNAAFTFWSGNRPLPSAESDRGRTWEQLDAMNTAWVNWQMVDWYLLLYGNLKAEGVVE